MPVVVSRTRKGSRRTPGMPGLRPAGNSREYSQSSGEKEDETEEPEKEEGGKRGGRRGQGWGPSAE